MPIKFNLIGATWGSAVESGRRFDVPGRMHAQMVPHMGRSRDDAGPGDR